MTGGKASKLREVSPSNFENKILGSARQSIISEFETMLIGCNGDKKGITNRISNLRHQIQFSKNKNESNLLKLRISRMEGKSAIITVGGYTEVEIIENRDKIVDSLNSCKSALEEGIMPGGGTAYIHALKELNNLYLSNPDLNAGVNLFIFAIKV